MLDSRVRRIIDPALESVAGGLHRLRVPASLLTVGGFLLGATACIAITQQAYSLALGLILLNRLADGLDGCVARQSRPTDAGGYLDIVLDLIFYSGVPFAFAVASPQNALPAAFVIYSFLGTGGSFLAFAVFSAKRGLNEDALQRKAFFYSTGLMEGTETVVFLVLLCLLPQHFALLAGVFGSLCWLTTLLRIATAIVVFREPAEPSVKSQSPVSRLPEARRNDVP